MRVAFCRGGYGALPAFFISAFARRFAVHPVQGFVWLHAHRLPRLRLRTPPRCFGLRPRWRLRLPRPCPRLRPCGFWAVSQEMGADFAMGPGLLCGFRRQSLLSASPTWGNAGTEWRFGPILPAKPPSSCKWGSLTLKVAHEAVQLRCRRGDAEHTGAFAECGDRNTLAE